MCKPSSSNASVTPLTKLRQAQCDALFALLSSWASMEETSQHVFLRAKSSLQCRAPQRYSARVWTEESVRNSAPQTEGSTVRIPFPSESICPGSLVPYLPPRFLCRFRCLLWFEFLSSLHLVVKIGSLYFALLKILFIFFNVVLTEKS